MLKLYLDYEARRSGGILVKQTHRHFCSLAPETRPPQPGLNSHPWAQQCKALATAAATQFLFGGKQKTDSQFTLSDPC